MRNRIITVIMAIFMLSTGLFVSTACDNGTSDADILYAATVMNKAIDEIDHLNTMMFSYADNDTDAALLSNKGNQMGAVSPNINATCFSAPSLYTEINEKLIPSDVELSYENPKQAIAKQLNAKYPFEVVDYLLKNAVNSKYYKKKYEINQTFFGEATHIINANLNEYFNLLNIKPTLAVKVQKEEDGIFFKADWDWRDPVLEREAPAYNTVICTNGKIIYDNNGGKVKKIYMNWYWEECQGDFMACLLDLEVNEFYYIGAYRSGEYLPQQENFVELFNSGENFAENFINQNYKGASVVKANVADSLDDFDYIGYKYWDSDTSSKTNVVYPGDVTEQEYISLINEVYSKVSAIKLRGEEGYLNLSDATEIDYMNNAAIYAYNRTVTTVSNDGMNYLYTDKKDMGKILDGLGASEIIMANADAMDLISRAKLELKGQDDRYIGDLGHHFGSGIEYGVEYASGYTYDDWCHYCDSYRRIIRDDKVAISFDYAKNKVSNVIINEEFINDPEEEKIPFTLRYEYNEELKGYSVSGCIGYLGEDTRVEIPATYRNKPVVKIGEYALSGCGATEIIIPSCIISIEKYAFQGCSKLTSIVITDGVKEIGEQAFSECTSLISIEIPKSVISIGKLAFRECSNLIVYCKSTSKPTSWDDDWRHINLYTSNLVPVVWDYDNNKIAEDGNIYVDVDGLRYVLKDGKASLINVVNLQKENTINVIIPTGILFEQDTYIVTTIEDRVFRDYANLVSVILPSSLKKIGATVFAGCVALANIALPSSLEEIGRSAFMSCGALTSIEIPNSVTSIGSSAFSSCSNLKSINTGNGITTLSGFDISICEYIHLGSGITDIGNPNRFSKCIRITVDENNAAYKDIDGDLYSKDGKTLIRYAGGKTATTFTIPEGVDSVGTRAFYNCYSLTSVDISDSVTEIGDNAFYGCINLKNIRTGNGITSLSGLDISICEYLHLGSSIVDIGDPSRFSKCISITVDENNATYKGLDGNLYSKDEKALIRYAGGKTESTFTIPEGVTSIGERAFYDCPSLTCVNIPENVTTIGREAFYCRNGLLRIYCEVKNQPRDWHSYFVVRGVEVFWGSSAASETDEGLVYVIKEEGVFVVEYTGEAKELTLNEIDGHPIVEIEDNVFKNCTSLYSVSIGDSVTRIGHSAFEECSNLRSVEIGNGVIEMCDLAFAKCRALTSVKIGDKVERIGGSAFEECSSLISVEIGDKVTEIRNNTFARCSALTSVTIGDGVTRIEVGAFEECISLLNVEMGESVIEIEDCAFAKCGALTNIKLGDNVERIGSCAFEECISLITVEIDNKVTYIDDNAFVDCNNLTEIKYNGTAEDWIAKRYDLQGVYNTSATKVICVDGEVELRK